MGNGLHSKERRSRVINHEFQNQALLMKKLDKFFNKKDKFFNQKDIPQDYSSMGKTPAVKL